MVKHGDHFVFTEDTWLGDYVVIVGRDVGEPVVDVTGVLVQSMSGKFLVAYLEVFIVHELIVVFNHLFDVGSVHGIVEVNITIPSNHY